jgi:hypothetical protein
MAKGNREIKLLCLEDLYHYSCSALEQVVGPEPELVHEAVLGMTIMNHQTH